MTKQKIYYLDTLRALATLGVIVIHVATPALKMNYGKNPDYWMIANIVDSAVRCIVPVFLMLTGATMLGWNYDSVPDFYIKRIRRVMLPFMFWMVLYWVYFWLKLPAAKQPHDVGGIVQWAIQLLIDVGISKHFWYFYMILAVYFLIPYMARFVQKISRSMLLYTLIGWAVFCFFTRDVPVNMYGWSAAMLPGKLLGWTQHAGYIVLGYYLATLPAGRMTRGMWAVVYAGTVGVCAFLTWYLSKQSGHQDLSVYGYIKPNTLVQSVAFYMMFKNLDLTNKWVLAVQHEICNYSYGIYLAHVMVLSFFFDHGFYWKIGNPLWSIAIVSVSALLVCYVFVFLLRKVPLGKHISG